MPPKRPRSPSGIHGLDWVTTDDGSATLWDTELQETYHSGCGAVAESLYVYLVNSGVYQRLIGRQPTSVMELGLGTGTNLLLTAALAEHFEVQLDYWAIENRLLPTFVYEKLDLARHLSRLTSCDYFHSITKLTREFAESICKHTFLKPESVSLSASIAKKATTQDCSEKLQYVTWPLSEHTSVNLLIGNAVSLPEFCVREKLLNRFSAVYFDPFSPKTNPDLWTFNLFQAMYHALTPGGTLTSYCVKSSVRRLMQQIGFEVHRLPGPVGGKREVLRANRPAIG